MLNPLFIFTVIISLTIHEWAHAYTALKLGDDTAKNAGRVTLNPLAHLDFMGSLAFLLIHFGWAKPVPVDARAFKHPVAGGALVSFAGPASNICLALLIGFILQNPYVHTLSLQTATVISEICKEFFVVNLSLAAFNLLPIGPLDGSGILRLFIPKQSRWSYDLYVEKGPYILFGAILIEQITHIPVFSLPLHFFFDPLIVWTSGIISFFYNTL